MRQKMPNDTASHARRAEVLDYDGLIYSKILKPIKHEQRSLFWRERAYWWVLYDA
jgi:hypothetical protein